jgi:hypothetical protein
LSFVVGAFLTVMPLGGAVGELFVNGVLGLSTGSPSIDRHLWAVRCGYAPGLRVAGCGSGVSELLAWLRGLDIEVAEPLPPVCVGASAVAVSADAVMLKTLVDDVFFGVVTRCEVERRIPRVGEALYAEALRDRAKSWRSAP